MLTVVPPEASASSCWPKTCGGLNITYPFWVQEPSGPTCGSPYFQINCTSTGAFLVRSVFQTYQVLYIFTHNNSVHVVDHFLPLANSCPAPTVNISFPTADLITSKANRELLFLGKCTGSKPESSAGFHSLACDNTSYVRLGDGRDFSSHGIQGGVPPGCLFSVVPIRWAPDGNGDDYIAGMRNGFLLEWTEVPGDCPKCMDSGGECVYSNTGDAFNCSCSGSLLPEVCACAGGASSGRLVAVKFLHDSKGEGEEFVNEVMRPQNILLDQDFHPKIADFGLAKLCRTNESKLSMSCARGTVGFIAPEVHSRTFGVVSTKSDVYSYGMMLLEMVGGRKNVKSLAQKSSEKYFPHWIYDHFGQNDGLKECEVTSENEAIAKKMSVIGLWCIQILPMHRPTITKVLEMFERGLNDLDMPPRQNFSQILEDPAYNLNVESSSMNNVVAPMAPWPLFFLVSSVLTALLSAAADGQAGERCSPVLCGNVSIVFPFGIIPEQAMDTSCGGTGFQVRCANDTPYLGYARREHWFQILDIFYGNASLLVADVHKIEGFNISDGSNGCHILTNNTPGHLGLPFSISPVNQNLIFYNCTTKASAVVAGDGLVETKCRNGTFVRVGGRYDGEFSSYGSYFMEGCDAVVVPVLGRPGETNASSYEELISDGLLLTWQLPPGSPSAGIGNTSCFPATCGGLDITYPFSLAGVQPRYCGFPVFQLTCNGGRAYLTGTFRENLYRVHNITYENTSLLAPLLLRLLLPISLLLRLAIATISISSSNETSAGNTSCSPATCGGLSIAYPFSLAGAQPQDCGFPVFQLTCNGGRAYLTGTFRENLYRVHSITYENSSLVVAVETSYPGDETCHIPDFIVSSSLALFPLDISHTNKDLFFLYNCAHRQGNPSACPNRTIMGPYDITEGHGEEGKPPQGVAENCSYTSVPVRDVKGMDPAHDYVRLISDGFLVEWWPSSSVSDCRQCRGRGGECRFPDLSFQCVCPDGLLCRSDRRKKHMLILIVVLSAAASFILACLVSIIYCRKEKRIPINQKYTGNKPNIEEMLKGYDSLVPKRYKYAELKKITRSFKDKLGEGGYGLVFRGNLEDGREVAVKLLKGSKGNGQEFVNEVVSIRQTSHVNIVNLLGFCLHGSKRALIYEYMAKGSLEKYIYSEETKRDIGWEKLREIAIGIARGLEYLHRGCNTRIIHFDIKPNNILLDEEFCPKISDFGLARLCHLKDSALSMAEARGTIGFIAPKVFSRGFGVVSTKSDVYSYGMMLLDMVGGRKNLIQNTENSSHAYFPNCVYDRLVKDLQSHEVICETEEIGGHMTLVGLWCIQMAPRNRPSMSRVIEMLEKTVNELEIPPKPLLSCPSEPLREISLFKYILPQSKSKTNAPLLLQLLVSLLLLLHHHALADCEPATCGNLTVRYPFWLGTINQSSSPCGHPAFEILCSADGSSASLKDSAIHVLGIDYSNNSFVASDTRIAVGDDGVCRADFNMSSSISLSAFTISSRNRALCFLYNCNGTEPLGGGYVNATSNCSAPVFAYLGGSYNWNNPPAIATGRCTLSYVPVLGPEAAAMTAANCTRLLKDGFVLEWAAATVGDCSACNASGGQCRYDSAAAALACHCPDGNLQGSTCAKDGDFNGSNCKLTFSMYLCADTEEDCKKRLWFLLGEKTRSTSERNIEALIVSYRSLAPKRYRYSEVVNITSSLNNKLGEGGYGMVYKGRLYDGRLVAVKFLRECKGNGEEFVNEVMSIGRTSHVNIVNLFGFCLESSKRALIYEYMPNGSLDQYTFSENPKETLWWQKLYTVAIGIARGLEYLHHSCNTRIVHFDIKPQNILLDQDFCPKIADFGLTKLCHTKEIKFSVTGARGTIGFIAPEVHSRTFGAVSTKSDVYSYGMMLLEMVGGRKNVKSMVQKSSEKYFPDWIHDHFAQHDGLKVCEVTSEVEEIARKMTLIGLWCIQILPMHRPTITHVLDMFERSLDKLDMPPKQNFSQIRIY
ncbi:hypothetical protein U9M48_020670 [Paspalum notatum var. saurae]|uniref:Protein kinase domain-containing protein n=1 Tax=Paspalum notatum var. saurae TaxID=547442 RepID=A0AAQ3TFB0_PASNO